MKFPPQELVKEISELLHDKPEAMRFLMTYGHYIEHIDDLIDEPKDVERITKVVSMAEDLFSSNYWQQNCNQLWLVEKLIHREYFDSVQWENDAEEWKRRDAKCMSHCGYNMLFAIIQIEAGGEALRKLSLRFREQAHLLHINDPI